MDRDGKYLAKTAYFVRVTYKPSGLKNENLPSEEFISMVKSNAYQQIAQYLQQRPITNVEIFIDKN